VPKVAAPKNDFSQRELFYRDLGKRIQAKRLEKNFSQQAVASAVGLSRTSLTNIEKGRQNVLLHTFVDIAAELGAEPKELLPGKPRASDDVQKKLDGVAPEFRDFVTQTIGQTDTHEQNNNLPESSSTPKESRHSRRTRGR
jgi:transcriptional regulator with XRE-family HTH domain